MQHTVVLTEEAPQFLTHDFRQRLGSDDPLRGEMFPACPEESVGFPAGKNISPIIFGTESDSGNEAASEIDGANDQIQLLPGNLYKILEGPFVIILKSFFTNDQGTVGSNLMESVVGFKGSTICSRDLRSVFFICSLSISLPEQTARQAYFLLLV